MSALASEIDKFAAGGGNVSPSEEKEYIADFHIHSKFSRACSKDLLLPNIAKTASLKGIHLMGTGDFTHPEWFRMMREELVQNERGLYEVKKLQTFRPVELVPTSEISCIYKQGDKVRRLHLIVVMPTLEAVAKLNKALGKRGNLQADGRPILGMSGKELLKITLEASEDALFIPAHAWTPWFAVFGSKSGFDSLQECFEEMTPYVPAIETGLSSDPAMNWRLSELDNVSITSNSDAHSLDNLGREANVFRRGTGMTYERIKNILFKKEKDGFLSTIEFYPEEGKYHLDGHAPCLVRVTPEETKRLGGLCPKCGKAITVGVLSRVEQLANRSDSETRGGGSGGFADGGGDVSPSKRIPFRSIVPLREIIGEVLGIGKKSKGVDAIYQALVPRFGSEFDVLIHVNTADIAAGGYPEVAEAVEKMRRGDIAISPGYDGIYGTVHIYEPGERTKKTKQQSLFP